MKSRSPLIRCVGSFILGVGLDPRKTVNSLRFSFKFLRSLLWFLLHDNKTSTDRFKIRLAPVLSDCFDQSGVAQGHYFHQDLWASRKIFVDRPQYHIDVGSRIDGFIAHLLTFMDVTVLDVRPLITEVEGLQFVQKNLMSENADEYIAKSVSCLHTIEHFGLGRYGDPLDIDGWKKGLQNLSKLVADGGKLYLSVPVGTQVVEFNAHRIFDPNTIVRVALENRLRLEEFSLIDDDGRFHSGVDLNAGKKCTYGCGCFEFVKK
jgi:hypothetical protein